MLMNADEQSTTAAAAVCSAGGPEIASQIDRILGILCK